MTETRFEYIADRLMWVMTGACVATYARLDWMDRVVVLLLILVALMSAALDLASRKRFPPRAKGGDSPHSDDLAVDRFAAAMKTKLAQKRAEGRGGWDDKDACSGEWLSRLLREHVGKGDPVDVANFAMMLHQRGERIAP